MIVVVIVLVLVLVLVLVHVLVIALALALVFVLVNGYASASGPIFPPMLVVTDGSERSLSTAGRPPTAAPWTLPPGQGGHVRLRHRAWPR